MIDASSVFGPPPRPHWSPKREAALRRWKRVDQLGPETVRELTALHPALRRLPNAHSLEDVAAATGLDPDVVADHIQKLDRLLVSMNPVWGDRLEALFSDGVGAHDR